MKPLVRKAILSTGAVFVVLLGSILVWLWLTAEPRYQGRSLSEWVRIHAEDPVSARKAVLQIGTDALPTIARKLQTQPRSHFAYSILKRFGIDFTSDDFAENEQAIALAAIRILGDEAADLIPLLTNLLADTTLGWKAAMALQAIGDKAQPAIHASLLSTNSFIKSQALKGLANSPQGHRELLALGTNADPVLRAEARMRFSGLAAWYRVDVYDALLHGLDDPYPNACAASVIGLRLIGDNGTNALPKLYQLKQSSTNRLVIDETTLSIQNLEKRMRIQNTKL